MPELTVQTAAGVARVEDKLDSLLRRLEAEKGIPIAVLQGILRRFDAKNHVPDDPAELQRRLEEQADEYLRLLARWESLFSDDPAVTEVRDAEREAIERGEFEWADQLLEEATDLDLAAASRLVAAARAKQRSAAESLVLRGETAHLALDYPAAARHCGSAHRRL
ncbi:MAG TPA: hypothetical protein VNS22_01355 [Geminicoccus sp.]|uniref:hypothetical protein n=1 Tax=Geminicoccus sp. TaxID=2024832 RepID=UPI002B8CDCC5|nr:hypothetical protein [Geminicoccus sp.]HWL67011.1 hypothetical protein [Geminicoccus sp.]